MKFTNEEIAHNVEVMSGAKETGKLGYAIARNLRKMKDEGQEYIQFREDALRKYGKINGNIVIVEKNNVEAYKAEMGDLPTEEHDVDIYQVSEDEFLSGTMNSQQMEALLWMIKEEGNG